MKEKIIKSTVPTFKIILKNGNIVLKNTGNVIPDIKNSEVKYNSLNKLKK